MAISAGSSASQAAHISRALSTLTSFTRAGGLSSTGPETSTVCGACVGQRRGDGIALLARGAVGDVAHRIDRFIGRPGGEDRLQTGKPPVGMDERRDRIQDFVRLRHATRSEFAAGHLAFIRADDMDAVGLERRDVAPRRGVVPHPHIHRGRDQDRLVGGKKRRRSKVGGKPGGELGDQIGRRGRDDHQIGGARQRDMAHFGFGGEVEQLLVDFLAGQRRNREGRHKMAARLGQDRAHCAPRSRKRRISSRHL